MDRDPRYDAAIREKVKELYESGLTIHQVSEKIGRSYSRTSELVRESGAAMRPRGRPPAKSVQR